MRRYILIFMMCLLPLQWSWAAAARVCQHEQGVAHFGHHEHQHVGAAQAAGPAHAADAAATEAGEAGAGLHDAAADSAQQSHPDCHTCHGTGVGYISTVDAPRAPWAGVFVLLDSGNPLPDPPPADLLRPPSPLVA